MSRRKEGCTKITKIEKHAGSGIWRGVASGSAGNYLWFYTPRGSLCFQKQDERNPRCWMNVDPPDDARKIVLKAVRAAKAE
jgi:hypothetical protein